MNEYPMMKFSLSVFEYHRLLVELEFAMRLSGRADGGHDPGICQMLYENLATQAHGAAVTIKESGE